jgi:hypothetical protein
MGRQARGGYIYNSCWVKVAIIIVRTTQVKYKSAPIVTPIIIKTGLQLLGE